MVWQRRVAQRLLVEQARVPISTLSDILNVSRKEGEATGDPSARFAALMTLCASEKLTDNVSDNSAVDPLTAMRKWSARLTGERKYAGYDGRRRLLNLSKDKEPEVRAAVAVAIRQFTSGWLTVDSQPERTTDTQNLVPLLRALLDFPRVEGISTSRNRGDGHGAGVARSHKTAVLARQSVNQNPPAPTACAGRQCQVSATQTDGSRTKHLNAGAWVAGAELQRASPKLGASGGFNSNAASQEEGAARQDFLLRDLHGRVLSTRTPRMMASAISATLSSGTSRLAAPRPIRETVWLP